MRFSNAVLMKERCGSKKRAPAKALLFYVPIVAGVRYFS
jgi:hypothetical protein